MTATIWEKRAQVGQQQLEEIFWNYNDSSFNLSTPYYDKDSKSSYYRWMTQAIDVLLDGYKRTEEKEYINRMNSLISTIENKTNKKLITNFFDEMGWMALALLRAYKLTNDKTYLEYAENLWGAIIDGWNDHYGGGIAWGEQYSYYKNTSSNASAVILGSRLFEVSNKETYKQSALEIFSWFENNLVNSSSGFVWEGMSNKKNMTVDKNNEHTHNQGFYIGSCIELYKLTKDVIYLEKALRTANLTFKYFGEKNTNILRYEGNGDASLFKGIFIRYTEKLLQYNFNKKLYDLILRNGESAWQSLVQYKIPVYGNHWLVKNEDEVVNLASHVSGCKLMEAVNRLHQKYGFEE